MSSSSDFPIEYIDFHGLNDDASSDGAYKKLALVGASAVSLLCYEKPGEVAETLRTDQRFDFVKRNEIVSGIWALSPAMMDPDNPTKGDSGPLIAWSVRLQLLYLGFRGTYSVEDALTNIDARQATKEDSEI
ncbi:hypothetical protein TWF481_011044 [Arthrobotrys musiformis]|uniref:Uncharacterized protein n=1 Tax=Arthrobotrys musiformis TaxID=47236 RepID=A0AAV9VYM0_9PEZI